MFWRRGNYEFNTAEGIIAHVTQMSYNFWGTWFVGITANALSSLKAHQIDTDNQMSSTFVCWDIPFESAKLCKASLLALEGFDFISDDESDFIDNTYPNSFIYMYGVINGHTIQHIDVSNFKPVKALPENNIIVTEISRDGKETITRIGDEFDKVACAEFVEQIKQKFLTNQMQSLKIVHRSIIEMWFEFGEGCCTISYDSHTSQEGYIQSYRSESNSRKLIPFFEGSYPEYMVCKDVDKFIAILRYFLEKGSEPGKRQGVKWVVVKRENPYDLAHYSKSV